MKVCRRRWSANQYRDHNGKDEVVGETQSRHEHWKRDRDDDRDGTGNRSAAKHKGNDAADEQRVAGDRRVRDREILNRVADRSDEGGTLLKDIPENADAACGRGIVDIAPGARGAGIPGDIRPPRPDVVNWAPGPDQERETGERNRAANRSQRIPGPPEGE